MDNRGNLKDLTDRLNAELPPSKPQKGCSYYERERAMEALKLGILLPEDVDVMDAMRALYNSQKDANQSRGGTRGRRGGSSTGRGWAVADIRRMMMGRRVM